MNPLAPFIGTFIAVSAVTALVQALVRHEDPRLVAREAIQFFLLIVAGIGLFSVVVFFLEWAFIRRV